MALKHRITINVTDPHGKTRYGPKRGGRKAAGETGQIPVRGFHAGVSAETGTDGQVGGCQRSQGGAERDEDFIWQQPNGKDLEKQ